MLVCRECHESFLPRVAGQAFCSRSCRRISKANETRAARELWRRAGRPMFECAEAEEAPGFE
jgi:hypothetical protein